MKDGAAQSKDIERRTGLRTWVEIDSRAAGENYAVFRKIVKGGTKMWSVVKSNAYGHGLVAFSRLMDNLGIDGFCVDSLVEGLRLREEGVQRPILVLGHTLPELFSDAAKQDIAVSISSFEILDALRKESAPPDFHIKIDTGMHRQGFMEGDMNEIIRILSRGSAAKSCKGVFTHFASAKDLNYPTFTDMQTAGLCSAQKILRDAGFSFFVHAAATGGTLAGEKYHFDAVRIGIGLYGLYPSREFEMQLPSVSLSPVLSWKTVIAEVKNISAGEFVGYDLSERVHRKTKIAVLPIGYWHGFPRAFSGRGEVLIQGSRAKVLGKVSMDMTVVDVTDINCAHGDVAVIIGRQGKEEITAEEAARTAGTIHYELLTRINPLIERIVV